MLQTVRSNAPGARPLGERELHPEIPLPGRNDAGLFSPGTLPRAGHPLPDDIAHAPAAAVSLGLPVCVSCAGRSHWLRGDSLTRGRQCALSIEAVLDGEGELVAGRRRYALHPGDVFILRPGERHVCRAVSRAPFRKAFIRLAVLSRLQRDVLDGFAVLRSTRLSPSAHHMARVNAALDAIHAALRDAPWTCHNEVSASAYSIILTLAESAGDLSLEPVAPPARVQDAVRAALAHLHEKVTVSSMARAAGCTPDHLNRLFARHLGMSSHHWLARAKLSHAATRLAATRMKVHEIAESVGYANAYCFCHAFKHLTRMSPLAFRRKAWRASPKCANHSPPLSRPSQ